MIEFSNVGLRYGQGPEILRDLDFRIDPGSFHFLTGPSGAGKSSLLGALCGELQPSAGAVNLDGRPLAQWDGQLRAQRLAVLPQSSTLNFAFSAEAVVAMGRLPHASGARLDSEIVTEALSAADAQHLAGRNYLELSGGERQRVHLARVLAQLWPGQSGQVLLLDEPTSMLDPLHQHITLRAVRAIAASGCAVLVVLHDLNLAARYCDRLLLLADGQARALGSPHEVLQADLLEAVFGLQVLVQPHPELGHPLIIAR